MTTSLSGARATWADLLSALAQAAQDAVFHDPGIDSEQLEGEGLEYLLYLLGSGAFTEVWNHDSAYPQLTQYEFWNNVSPDCLYLHAPVHGDYTYRIHGRRGSSHLFDIESHEGDFAYPSDMRLFSRRDDFATGPDGEIEIVLSREEQDGNWLGLAPGAGFVTLRQYFYDWETEDAARLVIEREGATYPPPPLATGERAERLQLLVSWMRTAHGWLAKLIEQYHAADPGTVPFPAVTLTSEYGFDGMRYGQGHFRFAPDEAVILEAQPPDCDYWGILLADPFWESMDWQIRQTSLNGHQAMLDADGMFRAVIAHQDPGVPNWLDTDSHTAGLIMARYYRPKIVVDPTLRVVPLEKVRDYLPTETPVVSPAERSDSVRRRMLSVRRRQGMFLGTGNR